MIILNGGGIREDAKEGYIALSNNIDKSKKLLYIPLAWEDESFKNCLKFISSELKDYEIINIHMITSKEEFSNLKIEDYSGIFIGGGNTYKLLKYLKESEGYNFIENFINNNGVVFGGSAGAIIFGKDISSCNICSNDENKWKNLNTTGFNLLDNKSLACHFQNTEEQKNKIKKFNTISEVITLTENETLIIKKNTLKHNM